MKVKQLKNTGISGGVIIHKLGIQANPGDQFKLTFKNNSLESIITIGETGIYEINMDTGITSVELVASTTGDYTIDILYSEEG